MTSHGDQDVPARTSDTSIAASGCSAVGLPDGSPFCPQPTWDGELGDALHHPCSIQHPPCGAAT